MPDQRTALVGLTSRQIQDIVVGLGERPFRGSQIAGWVYRKQAESFEEMSDLPAALRQKLSEDFAVSPLQVADHRTSSDGVDKLLVHKGDGQVYECVLLPYADRVSCCLSSQVGCPMACTFCATGLGGFDRNLTVGEIVGQYLLLQRFSPRRVGHVVFMGMGEPLLNLENLLAAIRILSTEVGLSLRHITVSTVGLVPQIDRLAAERLPIHLALSLHSPIDEVRSRLMPVNNRWPVAEVVEAMRRYQAATGRKVTFEYLLIDQTNDTPEQAEHLARLVKGLSCVVNLIPFNYVETPNGFRRPGRERVAEFRRILESRRVNVTERVERGHDIAAACGQLAGQHAGRFGRRPMAPLTVAP
ncbi:MAG: 23S rRNA (adenine(2503)-C(2))-methyltransferase RlmN [Fimbriimonadaceae bacterium]|nr:23S rRNA (adenine(2503)-C(2))-methyltransferase RlmN [Fimbriimonadaceae bacterium]QYK57677.1 MAG: 23S rRNA (adenine(2503)-C(2))-methyltransferase RlmN [Fimbriimonadaceae bacterium]